MTKDYDQLGDTLNRQRKRIQTIRKTLMGVAIALVVLILALLLYDRLSDIRDQFEQNFRAEMVNPNFRGVTDDGQDYHLTAARALQKDPKQPEIDLEMPVARVGENEEFVLTSKRGQYIEPDSLVLIDDVHVQNQDGAMLSSSQLHVNLSTNHIQSHAAVIGKTDTATITAKDFSIIENGQHFIFHGPAKLVIQP